MMMMMIMMAMLGGVCTVQVLPGTVDIRRVERYELLMQLLNLMRRRRRLLAEYQALLARVVMATEDAVQLEVSVYDRLHDEQAKRFRDAMVSLPLN